MNENKEDLSYIGESENEAKDFIEQHLGFPAPRMTGYHMAVKIYVRPEECKEITDDAGVKKSIYLPEVVTSQDKWRNCTALVVSQGNECYKTGRFAAEKGFMDCSTFIEAQRTAEFISQSTFCPDYYRKKPVEVLSVLQMGLELGYTPFESIFKIKLDETGNVKILENSEVSQKCKDVIDYFEKSRIKPWCKVGDWIVIPRNEGTQVNYRGIPMQFIPDDKVLAIIEDPTHVTRD